MPTIICTVTNDLSYDQRMHRICSSLAQNGYQVTLVGRALPHSVPLDKMPFQQHRLHCRFQKGFLFYAEFNLRLWLYLMRTKYDAVCSVDFDTLPAGCFSTLLRRKKRVFDAHEYFTEVPEVTGRPFVQFFWSAVARICLLFYRHAYTVGPALAAIFSKKYGIKFEVVRNSPALQGSFSNLKPEQSAFKNPRILLYQGALNEARGIEQMLEAMQYLDGFELWLAGEGDLSAPLREMAAALGVQNKVQFLGYLKPDQLQALTQQAWLGINVLENKGLSYYYSLANKFFDYVQAGVPVLTMDFPEYRALNQQFRVAVLLDQISVKNIVSAVQHLQENPQTYQNLQSAAVTARSAWSWEKEEPVLLACWKAVFRADVQKSVPHLD